MFEVRPIPARDTFFIQNPLLCDEVREFFNTNASSNYLKCFTKNEIDFKDHRRLYIWNIASFFYSSNCNSPLATYSTSLHNILDDILRNPSIEDKDLKLEIEDYLKIINYIISYIYYGGYKNLRKKPNLFVIAIDPMNYSINNRFTSFCDRLPLYVGFNYLDNIPDQTFEDEDIKYKVILLRKEFEHLLKGNFELARKNALDLSELLANINI